YYRGAYGAERALLSLASRREAVRAAHRERDSGQAGVLGRGERGHHLAVPERSRRGGRVRRVELRTTAAGIAAGRAQSRALALLIARPASGRSRRLGRLVLACETGQHRTPRNDSGVGGRRGSLGV